MIETIENSLHSGEDFETSEAVRALEEGSVNSPTQANDSESFHRGSEATFHIVSNVEEHHSQVLSPGTVNDSNTLPLDRAVRSSVSPVPNLHGFSQLSANQHSLGQASLYLQAVQTSAQSTGQLIQAQPVINVSVLPQSRNIVSQTVQLRDDIGTQPQDPLADVEQPVPQGHQLQSTAEPHRRGSQSQDEMTDQVNQAYFPGERQRLPNEEDDSSSFVCPICLEVCEEAVETPCCHNLFCSGCLLSKEHRIQKCPICKRGLEVDRVRANIPVRRMIADLSCACRFSGCEVRLRRRDRLQHEARCNFAPVSCPYSTQCGRLLRNQLLNHQAMECMFRPITCPMNCSQTIAFHCLEEHLGYACPRVLCACEFCEVPFCRADITEHQRSACPLATVSCTLLEVETQARCNHKCHRQDLPQHQQVCEFRGVLCSHTGCTHSTTSRLIASHEEDCEWRLVTCLECQEDVCLGLLQGHLEADCPDHVISCPFSNHGCTEMVPRRLIEDHLQQSSGRHLGLLCSALEFRDAEIELLKMEVAQLREGFEQRLMPLERAMNSQTAATVESASVSPTAGQAFARANPANAGSLFVSLIGSERLRSRLRQPTQQPSSPGLRSLPVMAETQHRAQTTNQATAMWSHPGQASAASLPHLPHIPGNPLETHGDLQTFPGPTWDRDLAASPPGALQPLMLLRDSGVSQMPFRPRNRSNPLLGSPSALQSTPSTDRSLASRRVAHSAGVQSVSSNYTLFSPPRVVASQTSVQHDEHHGTLGGAEFPEPPRAAAIPQRWALHSSNQRPRLSRSSSDEF